MTTVRPLAGASRSAGQERLLRLGVDRRQAVVEDQDACGSRAKRARDARALALAARERHAPLADELVDAVGEARRPRSVMPARSISARTCSSSSSRSAPKRMFSMVGLGEQEAVLGHVAQRAAQVGQGRSRTGTRRGGSRPRARTSGRAGSGASSCPSRSDRRRPGSCRPGSRERHARQGRRAGAVVA